MNGGLESFLGGGYGKLGNAQEYQAKVETKAAA